MYADFSWLLDVDFNELAQLYRRSNSLIQAALEFYYPGMFGIA